MGYITDIVSYDMNYRSEQHRKDFLNWYPKIIPEGFVDKLDSSPVHPEYNIVDNDDPMKIDPGELHGKFYEEYLWGPELAKYIEGYMEFAGEENGDYWRLDFKDGRCYKTEGAVVFPVEMMEELKVL